MKKIRKNIIFVVIVLLVFMSLNVNIEPLYAVEETSKDIVTTTSGGVSTGKVYENNEPQIDDKTITVGTISYDSVTLTWIKATDDTSDQSNLEYQVYYSNDDNIDTIDNIKSNGMSVGEFEKNINLKEINWLEENTNYFFNIIVKDEGGKEAAYNSINITTPISDETAVNIDKENISIEDCAYYGDVIQNIELPTIGSNGTTIKWISSDISIIDNNGFVADIEEGSGVFNVILSATISKGDVSNSRDFPITVKETEKLAVTIGHTAEELINKILGDGIVAQNVTTIGNINTSAAGIFTGGKTIIGFEEGIILSTGNAKDVVGPNKYSGVSTGYGLDGDTDLTLLAGLDTYDAAIIEFDFIPENDNISFQYVFSSDEYNEYANSGYNDSFAFILNGENIAVLPNTTIPVSINNVNGGNSLNNTSPQNQEFYRNNNPSTINTEMDGLTVVMSVSAQVNKGEVNHIKLAIADGGDCGLDSNVFIKANSIKNNEVMPGVLSINSKKGQDVYVKRQQGTDGTVKVDFIAKDSEGNELINKTITFEDEVDTIIVNVPEETDRIIIENPVGGAVIEEGKGNLYFAQIANETVKKKTIIKKNNKTTIQAEINGQKKESLATAQTQTKNGKKIITIEIDQQKLEQTLKEQEKNTKITIPIQDQAGTVVGQLNGQAVKSMEQKEAVVEIKTQIASYTLPAKQIRIDEISKELGEKIELKDIRIEVEIGETQEQMVKVVENTTKDGEFTLVVSPVDFTVKCTYKNKTIEAKNYSNYVQRTISIPEGVDPQKITTGIIVYPDGSICHVPTQVIETDGKYYAKINSLTNSTYSIIWNPRQYDDVEEYWAKEECNEMGARMIVEEETENTFNPNQEVTRLVCTQTIVRALGLGEKGTKCTFIDVGNNESYFGGVATSVEYNLVFGYTDNTFRANNTITRQEAAAIISRAMKIAESKVDYTDEEITQELDKFIDQENIDEWAKEYVAICSKSGLIKGNLKGEFKPKEKMTKAQLAVIIKRMLENAELI